MFWGKVDETLDVGADGDEKPVKRRDVWRKISFLSKCN